MARISQGRLIILTGPSCVGKSPLVRALAAFHQRLWAGMAPLVLYNSRRPRPGELDGVDYHFRTRDHIESLRAHDHFVVMDVRGDLQALDLDVLSEALRKGDVLFEGNPFVAGLLMTHAALAKVDRVGVFMSPLSREEIIFVRERPNIALPDLVSDYMRRKLLRRAHRQRGELSLRDLEEIERRASSAPAELREACRYRYVIPNHDGEDSENWDTFYYPLGEARTALLNFVSLLEGSVPRGIEHWEENLLR